MNIGTWTLSCACALLGLAIASGAQAAACGDLKAVTLPGMALKISKADELPAGPAPPQPFGPPLKVTLPPRCEVEGTINERTGAEGRTYAIGFAVALPDNWNGRFLFQGGGGLDGFLQPPLGAIAAGDAPALVRGYAVASTDSGHKSQNGFFDPSFFADQQAALDFEYASIGTVTRL
ncbi:MAG TPA: tannase/feruloyl esterase family alpha/beta hydrolase, partial [Rhizomicrobium sp.]|nr:tannase/feruloyl esterase family alpha/beta hydrolase [Rhizomicrobium sp.]